MIMTAVPANEFGMTEREFDEAARQSRPIGDAMKVQALRGKMGALVIVSGDVAILAVSVLVLWLTKATEAVAAATLSGAFSAIASMTSAYFGIRAASNVAQGLSNTTSPG